MTTQERKKDPKKSSTPGKKLAEESTFGMHLGDISDQPLPLWCPPTPTREDIALQFSPECLWFRSLFSKKRGHQVLPAITDIRKISLRYTK
jgi:hypothetical protein